MPAHFIDGDKRKVSTLKKKSRLKSLTNLVLDLVSPDKIFVIKECIVAEGGTHETLPGKPVHLCRTFSYTGFQPWKYTKPKNRLIVKTVLPPFSGCDKIVIQNHSG